MKKNTKSKYPTREQWLEAAVRLMEPWFSKHDYKVPRVRVSCGWPSSRGLSQKRPRFGECWDKRAAEDKTYQIFLTPRMRHPAVVLGVLMHELVHAVVGIKFKHGPVFRKCALAVGLEGRMTSTTNGPALTEQFVKWVKKPLGNYPHALLRPGCRPTKKQTTRMILCKCGECGYQCRTSRKWLEQSGAPICPCNDEPMAYQIPEELTK